MKSNLSVLVAVALAPCAFAANTLQYDRAPVAKIDVTKPLFDVPKTLYGIFFEDINFSADGGIYPELVQNRGFEDHDNRFIAGWKRDYRGGGMGRFGLAWGKPVHPASAAHLRIESFGPRRGGGTPASASAGGAETGVRNDGYHGMYVEAGKKYDLSFYARALDAYAGGFRVVLEDKDGAVLAELKVANDALSIGPKVLSVSAAGEAELPDWKRYTATFVPTRTTYDAHLSLLLDARGVVEFEQVSLFPRDTFNGRKNGLRKDLVQLLKDLRPGIVRFPGGCLTEGRDFNIWYDWKRSVGDGSLESRSEMWNTWGYWQSLGLGYYEYFCLCEDIGAEPLPVIGSGLTCQFAKESEAAALSDMDYFATNALQLVEFASGDPAKSPWAALRAKMGHPKPFNLHYLGIGNENWDDVFIDRYLTISKMVRAAYPHLRIVSSAGPSADGKRFDRAMERLNNTNADVIDEHYYVPAEWLLTKTTRYDGYDRATRAHVYAGEYACHLPGRENNLYSALCEAAMMTGFDRNSDIVEMTSYAPLFGKLGHDQWKPDLIWYDNAKSFGTPNYYVQQLFARNLPTQMLKCDFTPPKDTAQPRGGISLGTWKTSAEFKDIRVTGPDGRPLVPHLADLAAWKGERRGKWTARGGSLVQEDATASDTCLSVGAPDWADLTLTLKARKLAGDEGFLIGFFDGDSRTRARLNLGGWGNAKSALEYPRSQAYAGTDRGLTIEKDRWYDLKVEIRGGAVSTWVDGKKIHDNVRFNERGFPYLFVSTGLDANRNEIVVKAVNVAEKSAPLTLAFNAALKGGKVKTLTLTGAPTDVNSLAEPRKVFPTADHVPFPGGKNWTVTLKPSSLTVFRIPR